MKRLLFTQDLGAGLALFSVAIGVHKLWRADSLTEFDIENESLKWLAISWALHEAMPGMVFAGYAFLDNVLGQKLDICSTLASPCNNSYRGKIHVC